MSHRSAGATSPVHFETPGKELLRELVDHEPPDPPPACFAPPDGHVATGAVDGRAGLGRLNLVVGPDVNRVVAGDDEVRARERERRNAVLRHLVDDERVDGRAIQVGRAREQKAYVARELTERHGRIALEPRLTVLLERGIDRGAVSDRTGDCATATCGDHNGDQEYSAGDDARFHSPIPQALVGCRSSARMTIAKTA